MKKDDGDSSYSLRMLARSMWRIRKAGKNKIYPLFAGCEEPSVLNTQEFVSTVYPYTDRPSPCYNILDLRGFQLSIKSPGRHTDVRPLWEHCWLSLFSLSHLLACWVTVMGLSYNSPADNVVFFSCFNCLIKKPRKTVSHNLCLYTDPFNVESIVKPW